MAHPSAQVIPSPNLQCAADPGGRGSPRQGWAKALQPPAQALPTFSPGSWVSGGSRSPHHREGNAPVPLQGHLGPPASPVLGGPRGARREEELCASVLTFSC